MILDIIILVVALLGFVFGYRKGIIGQIGQLLALLAGIVAARMFGPHVARFLSTVDLPGILELAVGYVLVFLAAFFLVWVIARILRKAVRIVSLGIIDRLCGAVFKAALWIFILSLILNIYLLIRHDAHALDSPSRPWRAAVARFAPATLGYLSDKLNTL